MHTALVVDDETAARNRLRLLLSNYQNCIEVIGEAGNGEEAVEKINTLRPEVVFLDIEMPGLSGLELIASLTHFPNIVFVTAYHQYAVKAFEQNSLDYLLKPVERDRLDITIKRLEKVQSAPRRDDELFQRILEQITPTVKLDSIPVNLAKKIIFIPLEEIIFFEANEKYVFIQTFGSRYLIDYTLTYLLDRLPEHFIRIHRTFVINRRKIEEVQRHFKSTFLFTMQDKEHSKVSSGNTYYNEIKRFLRI